MRRTIAALVMVGFTSFWGRTETYNLRGVVGLTIPNRLEVLDITESLYRNDSGNQIWFRVAIALIYGNLYLPVELGFFGDGVDRIESVRSFLAYDGKIREYRNRYNLSSQLDHLFGSYQEDPLIASSGMKYSKFIAGWPSFRGADYLGYYFRIVGDGPFTECIVSIDNSWRALGSDQKLPMFTGDDFEDFLSEQTDAVVRYYELVDGIIHSIVVDELTRDALEGYLEKLQERGRRGWYTATAPGLRLRNAPGTEGAVIGQVETDRPYFILDVGPSATIGGVAGNWVRVSPFRGDLIGWSFDPYLREMTAKEKQPFLREF